VLDVVVGTLFFFAMYFFHRKPAIAVKMSLRMMILVKVKNAEMGCTSSSVKI